MYKRGKDSFLKTWGWLIVGIFLTGVVVNFSLPSTTFAQSNSELIEELRAIRASIDQATRELKTAQKQNFKKLQTALLESLEGTNGYLAEIQNQQNRRLENDQLYCETKDIFNQQFEINSCFVASNSGAAGKFSTSLKSVQEQGWHLTSFSAIDNVNGLAVFSKYKD